MSLICFVFTGSPTRSGTIWVLDGITGSLASANDCLSIAAEACCASRSTADDLSWRTIASAPAANHGERDVVRSEERRGGRECVGQWSTRWSRLHSKKK